MARRSAGVAVMLLLSIWLAVAGADYPVRAADPASDVNAIFAEWNSLDSPGCSVGVARGGEPILARAYGMADLEHETRNVPETIFEAGSVAKQFTAAAIVLLAQQGKLSIDDDVRKHVPEVPDYGSTITLRHLLTHTSGLRDWGTVLEAGGWPRGTRIHTHAHVLDIVSRQKAVNFLPGAEYLYSNTGYNLLAIIVERVSGQAFAAFTKRNIFEPLQMTRTEWRDDFARVVKGRAMAYTREGKGFRAQMPFENVHGNGGLLTTVADLLRWNENFVDGTVGGSGLRDELQRQARLTSGREIAYAQGLVVSQYRGVSEISHSGSTAGYRAFLARYPEQRVSVAVLCNVAQANATLLAHQVAEVFLGTAFQPERRIEAIEIPSKILAARAGLYRNSRTNEPLRIIFDGGRLRVEPGSDLIPLSESRFRFATGARQLEFVGPDPTSGTRIRLRTDEGDLIDLERVPEVAPTAVQLGEYEGEYHSDEAEATYVAAVVDGRLVLRRRPDATLQLEPAYTDAFTTQVGWLARFIRNGAGRIESLSLGLGRVRDLRFARVNR